MRKKIYSMLRGRFLVSGDSFKNWKVIFFISVLAIFMIASSHSADSKVYEMGKLTNEVKELRSELIDRRTELMQLKMESSIIKKVKKKGIQISEYPPRKIRVKSETK